MEPTETTQITYHPTRNYRWIAGVVLVLIGGILLAEQFLRTGWLPYTLLPVGAIVFLIWAILSRRFGPIIPGALIGGIGLGLLFAFGLPNAYTGAMRAGILLLSFALSWVVIAIASMIFSGKGGWWALVPAATIGGVGGYLAFSNLRADAFFVYFLGALAAAFLIWGIAESSFGLSIPGSILAGLSAGIYIGWMMPSDWNSLTRTGIMLIGFAGGWVLMSLLSLVLEKRDFAWWALIPGGALGLTGWGLYIGGDAAHAGSLLANTSAIVLIIFGLYLLLWRRGIRK